MRKHWIPLLLAVLLAAHFAWLCRYVVPAYASPDADGYFAQARLMATEGRVTFEAESPVQYIGMHWLETEEGRFISRYPPGLPVLLAGVWSVFGRGATFYLNPLLATLTLLLLFLLCRPWVGEKLALVAVVVFAVNPLANYHAIHSDAHTTSTFFLVGGLWLLDSWIRRGAWWRALGAGLVLGAIPAVRYAEAAAAIGIGVLVLLQLQKLAGRRKELLFLAAGVAVPVGLLMVHHQIQFGAVWKTGYALTNEQQIRWEYFQQNWRGYLDALMATGVGPFFVLGVAGLAGMVVKRETRALALGLGLVVAGIGAVYAGYYFNLGGGVASMRFLLPTLPLYILPAMWFFRQLSAPRVAKVALGVLLAMHLAQAVPAALQRMAGQREMASRSAFVLGWIEDHVAEGSIVTGSMRTHEPIHFTGKWKLADSTLLLGNQRVMDRADMLQGFFGAGEEFPMPMQRGKAEALRSKYRDLPPDESTLLALEDLRAWAGGAREIYWAGSSQETQRLESLSQGAVEFEKIGEIRTPQPDETVQAALGFAPGAGMAMMGMLRRRLGRPGGPGAGPPPGLGGPEGMYPPGAPGGPGAGALPGMGSRGGRGAPGFFPGGRMGMRRGGASSEAIQVYRLKF